MKGAFEFDATVARFDARHSIFKIIYYSKNREPFTVNRLPYFHHNEHKNTK